MWIKGGWWSITHFPFDLHARMAKPLIRVAIIGTSGRTEAERARLSAPVLEYWRQQALARIHACQLEPERVMLVSGGSAWADHVAVLLFLFGDQEGRDFAGLELHMPCRTSVQRDHVDGVSRVRWEGTHADGRRLYELHAQFSHDAGRDTLADLGHAILLGAQVSVAEGFLARNRRIARGVEGGGPPRFAIAFSAAPVEGNEPPAKSGTAYTWGLLGPNCTRAFVTYQPT